MMSCIYCKKKYILGKKNIFYLIFTFFRQICVPNQPKNAPGPYDADITKNQIMCGQIPLAMSEKYVMM